MNATHMTQVMKRTFTICLVTLGLFAGFAVYSKGRGVKANAAAGAASRAMTGQIASFSFTGIVIGDHSSTHYPDGTEFTGTFTFDVSNPAPNVLADGISTAYTSFPNYPMSISLTVGTETLTYSDCNITIQNTTGNDHIRMNGDPGGNPIHLDIDGINMFNSQALPTTLGGTPTGQLYFWRTGNQSSETMFLGRIERVFSTPPTPHTPIIMGTSLTRTAGSPAAIAQIATVADADEAPGSLAVTVNNTTVNGVSLSGLGINSSGQVMATVSAACTASNASFTMRVTDSSGLFTEAPLNVTVKPNSAPSLGNYPTATATVYGSTTVTPASRPSDNVSVNSVTVNAPGFAGTATVNPTTGAVSISDARPQGNFLFSVTATDNCGAQVTKTFTLTVVVNTNCGITVNPATLLQAHVGSGYYMSLSASPTNYYLFSVSAGALPPGLGITTVFGATMLTGTPTASGTYNFTLKATKNGTTCMGIRSYTMIIP